MINHDYQKLTDAEQQYLETFDDLDQLLLIALLGFGLTVVTGALVLLSMYIAGVPI